MKNLTDYSGEFLPDLKPGDLSRDALEELLKTYSRLYMAVDGFWYLSVKERHGNEAALACDVLTWQRQARNEMAKLSKRFKFAGNDVVALMKGFQLSPWYWTVETRIDIESPKRAVMTVIRCPTLEALEKEAEGREYQICNVVEPVIFGSYAAFFNPDIKVTCLKVPPRQSQSEIACRWKFKLD